MHGSLALRYGVLYVGRHAKTARVGAFDLDGHRLGREFTFRDEAAGRSAAAGLAVDDDRRIWIADTPANRVRCFNLFGREIGGVEGGGARGPVGVAAVGGSDGLRLYVAARGRVGHAVRVFDERGAEIGALRSLGSPGRGFERVTAIARRGTRVWVAEGGARRVQVFRDDEFLFAFELATPRGAVAAEPRGIAPLADGRVVVAEAGADGTGRAGSALRVYSASGALEQTLAEHGTGEGAVQEPIDVVADADAPPEEDESETRVAVLDRDGERVQVFTLAGRCYGTFGDWEE